MRTLMVALLVIGAAGAAVAHPSTTGTLSPNTTVAQPPATTPGGGTPAGVPTNVPTNRPPTSTSSTAAAPARDVAIVLCAEERSAGATRLIVFSASTSAGAPAVAPGAICAQALSDLFLAGFGVIDVQPFNQQLQYTRVR